MKNCDVKEVPSYGPAINTHQSILPIPVKARSASLYDQSRWLSSVTQGFITKRIKGSGSHGWGWDVNLPAASQVHNSHWMIDSQIFNRRWICTWKWEQGLESWECWWNQNGEMGVHEENPKNPNLVNHKYHSASYTRILVLLLWGSMKT